MVHLSGWTGEARQAGGDSLTKRNKKKHQVMMVENRGGGSVRGSDKKRAPLRSYSLPPSVQKKKKGETTTIC